MLIINAMSSMDLTTDSSINAMSSMDQTTDSSNTMQDVQRRTTSMEMMSVMSYPRLVDAKLLSGDVLKYMEKERFDFDIEFGNHTLPRYMTLLSLVAQHPSIERKCGMRMSRRMTALTLQYSGLKTRLDDLRNKDIATQQQLSKKINQNIAKSIAMATHTILDNCITTITNLMSVFMSLTSCINILDRPRWELHVDTTITVGNVNLTLDIITHDTMYIVRTPSMSKRWVLYKSIMDYTLLTSSSSHIDVKWVYVIDTVDGTVWGGSGASLMSARMSDHIKMCEYVSGIISNPKCTRRVGYTVKGSLTGCMDYYRSSGCDLTLPIQTFIGNRMSKSSTTPKNDIVTSIMTLPVSVRKMLFVHGAHSINFCNAGHSVMRHVNDLVVCSQLGFGGLVVHVGKNVNKVANQVALQTMFDRLSLIIIETTRILKKMNSTATQAPLLLETPAGQGTETLTAIHEMIWFCNQMRVTHGTKFGICIDTCHVFSLGYCPLYYMVIAKRDLSFPVDLLHFNDSKKHQGARVDRHASYGRGMMGIDRLDRVATWCVSHSIPMVSEPPPNENC